MPGFHGSAIFITHLAWTALGFSVLCRSTAGAEAAAHLGARFDITADVIYPASEFVVDVTRAPYNAMGDGHTDDTEAIQRALFDVMGQHKMLYFPNGTYLISKTLKWSKRNSAGMEAWGKNFIQGQNCGKTIIRLKDETFTNSSEPQSLMWCGGFGSADWFHNYIQDLTFDVGKNNPGAVGLQFYSNNSGAVRNCRFLGSHDSGLIGLDLGHRDMNGPLLVRNCEVVGFRRGVHAAGAVNGQTFEYLTLRGQSECGFVNEGQSISVRGLVSESSVPAVQTYGSFCLIDAKLIGDKRAGSVPAIVNYNSGRIYLRHVATTGYSRALSDVATPDSAAALRVVGVDKVGSEGPAIDEYCSHPATKPFATSSNSLRLDVKDPPALPSDDANTWANVDDFGADPTGQEDASTAIQRAIDSGATTIFLPGSYMLKSTVVIRGNACRLLGVGGMVNYAKEVKPDFRIGEGTSRFVALEHFAHINGGVEIDTRRAVLFRSVSDCDLAFTSKAAGGELYLEDFVTHGLKLRNQRVWARQLNIENEGTHLSNEASDLWVLGYKTERGGTLLETLTGGRSEILGGFSYTTTAGKLAPMFVVDNATVFAFFSEVCYSGDPFETLIRETQRGKTKIVKRDGGGTTPYIATSAAR